MTVPSVDASRLCWLFRVLGPCAVGALCVLSCAGKESDADQPKTGFGDEILAHGDELFPSETLTDWVSFTEQLTVVRVRSERELPLDSEAKSADEGYLARKISVTFEDDVWHRPEFDPQTGEFELATLGWQYNRGKKRIVSVRDGPRLAVGGRYLVALTIVNSRFELLSAGAVMAHHADAVATADVTAHGQNPVARMLSTMSDHDIAELLDNTAPYPLAAENWSATPEERLRLVRTSEN